MDNTTILALMLCSLVFLITGAGIGFMIGYDEGKNKNKKNADIILYKTL